MSHVTTTPDNREHFNQLMQMPIPALASVLTEETRKFLKHQPSDDFVGLALFTHAIAYCNDEAWTRLYQQYAPLVLTWITQHRSATPLLGQDGSGPLVNAAFAKFARALTPVKMADFDSLAAILHYLKLCVSSTVVDEVRSRQAHNREESLESIEYEEPSSCDPADEVVENLSALNLWKVLQEELRGEDERVLIYLVYIQGMKPSEISSQHQRLFPTVDDVYRIKRNVLERLRRNRRLRQMVRLDRME